MRHTLRGVEPPSVPRAEPWLARYRARIDPARLRRSSQRLAQALLLSAIVGVGTGLVVVGFQKVTLDLMWEHVRELPPWASVLPGAGLAVAWGALRASRTPNADTAEEYVRVYHERRARLRVRDLAAKLVAGAATIGSGGSVGLEGPSLLIGGTTGDVLQHRLSRFFDREDAKVMLVAGAAAGIAAVFKAPLTGLVFAMEVPYRGDVARHVLGPAMVAAAGGYLVEASLRGVTPLIPAVGPAGFDLRELMLSLALGLVAGAAARVIIAVFRRTGNAMNAIAAPWRIAVAGIVLAVIGLGSHALYGRPLALGYGEEAIHAAALGRLTAGMLLALLVMKIVGTSVTVGAGGVGGIFFQLVVMGTAMGGAVGQLVGARYGTLFPLVGMASLLGAAYHTPLAGVSFVAEATGRAGFIIPTFVATAAAYVTVGPNSISHRQRFRRAGPVERMLDVPILDVLERDPATVRDIDTLDWVVQRSLRHRAKTFPVVEEDGRTVLGVVDIDRVMDEPRERWQQLRVRDVMRTDYPHATSSWTARRALEAMAEADIDYLPVVDDEGRLFGVVITSEVFRLTEVLDRLRSEGAG